MLSAVMLVAKLVDALRLSPSYLLPAMVIPGLAYTRNVLQEIPYYSRGSGFSGSFLRIILVNFGLLQLIGDLLDPKNQFQMA